MTREMFTKLMTYIEMRIEARDARTKLGMRSCEELRLHSKRLEDEIYDLIDKAAEDGK